MTRKHEEAGWERFNRLRWRFLVFVPGWLAAGFLLDHVLIRFGGENCLPLVLLIWFPFFFFSIQALTNFKCPRCGNIYGTVFSNFFCPECAHCGISPPEAHEKRNSFHQRRSRL